MRKEERDVAVRVAGEVRRRRTACGWSQLALAERAGISLNYVGMLERAERLPSFEVLIRLARALGASLGAMVGDAPTGDPAPDPWLTEAYAILRTLPMEARPIVIGMLRGAPAVAPNAEGSSVRAKRRRKQS